MRQIQTNKGNGKRYRYSAYGIRIDSEIELSELQLTDDADVDIAVKYEDLSRFIPREPFTGAKYCCPEKNKFLFLVDKVAAFYVSGGDEILVHPYDKVDLAIIKLYLLGTSMGILLMQRGMAPLHGSTVVMNQRGVIFTGASGAGKSTIVAELRKRGFSMLSDDVSAIQRDDQGIYFVQPGYPQQKLWGSSAEMIGLDVSQFHQVLIDEDKYAVPVQEGFWELPAPVGRIYEIVIGPCERVVIEPLSGLEKARVIMENIYRVEVMASLGLQQSHFTQCVGMATQAEVFRLTRPENRISLEQQADLIISHCQNE
ncbi:MAG TPA: hypothetical protein VN611_06780 [Patescibacteria group bacterium]|nr:hypothetical protein [Patescibacteria group bacterium]